MALCLGLNQCLSSYLALATWADSCLCRWMPCHSPALTHGNWGRMCGDQVSPCFYVGGADWGVRLSFFLPAVSRVNTRDQGEELICGRGLGTWWTQSRAGRQDLCFPKHHLTFFKVTNSFSAQGRSDSSSSYL